MFQVCKFSKLEILSIWYASENSAFFHDQRVEEGLCDPEVPTSAPSIWKTYYESVVDEPQLTYQGSTLVTYHLTCDLTLTLPRSLQL
jgi:hypothetical protein